MTKELQQNARRIVHLTFYKCASQWVRDVLTDPEISDCSGYPLSVSGFDVAASGAWPEQPPSTFAGPIYSASYDEWTANAGPRDRAIVVLRDPRDLVISLVFSLGFSHVPSTITQLLRSPISGASDQDRVRIGIYLLTQWADRMRSWGAARTGTREYITTYRKLIARPDYEFASICRFLDWDIYPALLGRVVDRYSFEKRTGRSAGEVNPFSHLRKEISGDWRNHFDRTVGEEFEATFPLLLADLGFEQDADWYKSLPSRTTAAVSEETLSGDELLRQLAAFENQNLELEMWRTAAEDRLNDVDRLTAIVQRLEARVAAPNPETEQHLVQIAKLTGKVRNLERTGEERLADNSKLIATIQQLQTALQERLSDVDTLTRNVHELEARIANPDPVAEERLHDIQKLTSIIRILESGIAKMQAEQARSLGYRTYRLGLAMYSRLERIFR